MYLTVDIMIHTLSISFSDDVNTTATLYTATQSGDGQTNLEVSIPSGSSNFVSACNIDISETKGVLINSDINATIVFKSGSIVSQTMNFSGNKPLLWQAGFPNANPITGDFTQISITSATGDMMLRAYFLQDV